MRVRNDDPGEEVGVVHRWETGLTWMPHPDTQMQRASHALVEDGDVWLVDPLDAAGLDEALADTGFELVWEKVRLWWQEGALYHPGRQTLVVPDTLMTAVRAAIPGIRNPAGWQPELFDATCRSQHAGMAQRPAAFRAAIASGNSGRVTAAIETAKELAAVERARLFEACFEPLVELYHDGTRAQRLAVVRALRALVVDEVTDAYWEALWTFYCEAVQDSDERVRTAATAAIHTYGMVVAVRGEPVAPLAADLAALASDHTGATRRDIGRVRARLQRLTAMPHGDPVEAPRSE